MARSRGGKHHPPNLANSASFLLVGNAKLKLLFLQGYYYIVSESDPRGGPFAWTLCS